MLQIHWACMSFCYQLNLRSGYLLIFESVLIMKPFLPRQLNPNPYPEPSAIDQLFHT